MYPFQLGQSDPYPNETDPKHWLYWILILPDILLNSKYIFFLFPKKSIYIAFLPSFSDLLMSITVVYLRIPHFVDEVGEEGVGLHFVEDVAVLVLGQLLEHLHQVL